MKRARTLLAGLVGMALLVVACSREENKASAPVEHRAQSGGAPSVAASVAADRAAGDAQSREAAAPAAQGQSGAPLPGSERKVISNVFLDLVMKDVQSGFERIGAIAEANGGLVAESNVRREGDEQRATITIRVPAGRYQDVLGQIRGLAVRVESERANANDVTEEYTDLQSRQRNLEAAEAQLLVLLGQAKNIQEVLQVQDRLNSTRAEIERVKGRINLLTRLTDLATIQAQLRPESASVHRDADGGLLAALERGWNASTVVLGSVLVAVLTAAAFSWWLLPLAALAAWIARRELRRRGATQHVPPAQ